LVTMRTVMSELDGTFRLVDVTAGGYTLSAFATSSTSGVGGRSPAVEMLVEIAQDMTDVELQLTEGTTVKGRVVFASPAPADVARLAIYHRLTNSRSIGWTVPPVRLAADGTFEFTGLRGTIEFMVMVAPAKGPNSPAAGQPKAATSSTRGAQPTPREPVNASAAPHSDRSAVPSMEPRAPTTVNAGGISGATRTDQDITALMVADMRSSVDWRVRTVRVGGRDVTNEGVDVGQQGIVDGVEVEVVDDRPIVTGMVRDDRRRPCAGARLVVMPTDSRAAQSPEGLVQPRGVSRPDGHYIVGALAPGTWDIVALADVADSSLIPDDPETIERLRTLATRVTLSESQVLELDLRVVSLP
jgi:hypothetical protein